MRGRGWAVYFLGLLVGVAVLADVIASDRPLLVHKTDGWQVPVLQRVVGDGPAPLEEADIVVWAPVPFSARSLELAGSSYLPPLSRDERGRRHWLGTDRLGRDTAAGLVAGTRVAVIVGLGSLLLTLLIGVPLGGLAGFYGNRGIRVRRYTLVAGIAGGVLGVGYASACLLPLATNTLTGICFVVVPVMAIACLHWLVLQLLSRIWPALRGRVRLPLDRGWCF